MLMRKKHVQQFLNTFKVIKRVIRMLFVLFRLKLKTYKSAHFHRVGGRFLSYLFGLGEIHFVVCLLKLPVTLRIPKSVASLKIRVTSLTGLEEVVTQPQSKQGRLTITLMALPLVSQYGLLFVK